jgi:hypothetical protein
MKIRYFFTYLICLLSLSITAQNLVDFGSNWKYYDEGDEPPRNRGRYYYETTYRDNNWPSGTAQLGYGEGDEATTIASTVNGTNLISAYFRLDFTVNNPAAYPLYDVNLLYDDGAIVYLNGNEVFRANMSGAPDYNTLATGTDGNNALTSFQLASSDLQTGNNNLTVEVHQESTTSNDLSFDLEITEAFIIPSVVRGPYIQKLTPNSAVVKWRTSSPAQSVVKYGLSQATATNSVSDAILKTDHEIEITGLDSYEQYFYFLQDDTTTILPPASDQYFITAPTPGTVQPVTAWILGDPGTANNDARAVRDAYYNYIGADHTDMMLFLGDNAYNDGTDAQFQSAVFENMYEDKLKNTVSWSCLGNHDGYTADAATQTGPYFQIYDFPTNGEAGGVASGTEAYYSFDYANIHFIVLESYETDRSIGGAMYNWTELDIQNTTQDWIVAFWHHPAYTKGSHDSDNVNDSSGSMQDMRENFLPLLEQNGVDLVLSGHSHSYERSYFVNGHYGNSTTFDPSIHTVGANGYGDGQLSSDGAYTKDICSEGSVYITTGSAGKISNGSFNHPVFHYSAMSLGSVVMEVDGTQMDIKFVRETGAVDDFFTIQKGNFGISCDDGDPCTTNDIIDASCNCVGSAPDTDNDGVNDCLDECPHDPLKIVLGICGCSISDTADADSDGTPDCIDDCPSDPLKIMAGSCGCGIPDTPNCSPLLEPCVDTTRVIDQITVSENSKYFDFVTTKTTGALIHDNVNVQLSAGNYIELLHNFEVLQGAEILFYIEACDND